MLPDTGNILKQDFTVRKQPSRTYRLKNDRVLGYVDGLEAVKQAVNCILNTERFEHVIYSWNYGREFSKLYGRSQGMLESKIKKRIRSVGAFSFSRSGKQLLVTFTVSCDQGVFEAEKEVDTGV